MLWLLQALTHRLFSYNTCYTMKRNNTKFKKNTIRWNDIMWKPGTLEAFRKRGLTAKIQFYHVTRYTNFDPDPLKLCLLFMQYEGGGGDEMKVNFWTHLQISGGQQTACSNRHSTKYPHIQRNSYEKVLSHQFYNFPLFIVMLPLLPG